MRWQTTAALAVLLLAVGVFYYVYEIRLGPEREEAQARKGRLVTVELTDVAELKIERPDDTVHVQREGDGWQLLAPVRARGDRAAVEDVLTNVVTMRSDREIASNPTAEALADYGLDKPSATLTLVLKDGKQLGIALGGTSPTGTWVYAREAGRDAVVTVGDSVLRDVTRPVGAYRDKSVLTVNRQDVTGIEVETRDGVLAIDAADGTWRITKPAAYAADAEVIREFLDTLSGARVLEFVADEPPSRAPWGLDRPVRVAVHTGKDQDRTTRTVLLGRTDPEKKGVYAVRDGETAVVLLPEVVWTAVPRSVAVARDKTVVRFERDKITRIDLESPKGAVSLAKEGERWRITAPEALPADSVEAGGLLFKLRELRAQAFLSDDASALSRYLAKPQVRVTLAEESAEEPKTVLLAASSEQRGGQPSAYAGVAGRGPVVLVDGKALAELSKSVADLRDRLLLADLADLKPEEIQRLRIQRGDQTVLVERRGEVEWRMLEPDKRAAKGARVDDLLFALRVLRWKEIADAAGKDPAKYGLDAPALEVTFYRRDGGELATVQAGTPSEDRAYVRLKGQPAIFAVDPKHLGQLPQLPDDLQG